MELAKRTVYLPENEQIAETFNFYQNSTEGYFLTPEELNEYTSNVIKQALEIAAKNSKCCDDAIVDLGYTITEAYVDKESITNTFKEIFENFEVCDI